MTTRRKQTTKHTAASRTAARKFEGFTELLGKLEVEAEKVVRRLVEKTETSSRELKHNIQALVEQVRNEGIATVASEKKEDLRRLAEDVIAKAKEIQFLSNINRDDIVREAKKNLDDLINRINASDLMARARETAVHTKDQVLSILSIPSQSEVVRLQRKITNLESRVNKLTRKAA